MPLKEVFTPNDNVTFSNRVIDFIKPFASIELPLFEDESLDYVNCIVSYFNYNCVDKESPREYKLFKYYDTFSRSEFEVDSETLGQIQGIYILPCESNESSKALIESLNIRHSII
jgi:hypothetical protein